MATISGGAKLEAYLKKLSAGIDKARAVDVGFMADAQEPDGTSTAMVAAINEYGAPSRGQPPRPFFRNAIAKNSEKWGPNLATALKNNDFNASIALAAVGEEIVGEIKESINELFTPPLKESTIARKGFSKPLIDTTAMINATTKIVR